jgi:hypothetical protein
MKTGSQRGKHFPAEIRQKKKPEPENGAGYPAGTGLCRISGRFLKQNIPKNYTKMNQYHARIIC